MVYASGNLSLAMLELLVHIDDTETFRRTAHVYHEVRFPVDAVATLEAHDLPSGWNARPETRNSQAAGDEWIDSHQTPVLAVPSVIVPPDMRYDPLYMTYLINPNHPDYHSAVEIGGIRDLAWDTRLP